jgi:hypothetical protein
MERNIEAFASHMLHPTGTASCHGEQASTLFVSGIQVSPMHILN